MRRTDHGNLRVLKIVPRRLAANCVARPACCHVLREGGYPCRLLWVVPLIHHGLLGFNRLPSALVDHLPYSAARFAAA